jgi:hypothetical protein
MDELFALFCHFIAQKLFDRSVEAERKRQAKSLLKCGREFLWQGRFEEADVRFGAARKLDPMVVSTLSRKQRQAFKLELGESGNYGRNSREFWKQLNYVAKR